MLIVYVDLIRSHLLARFTMNTENSFEFSFKILKTYQKDIVDNLTDTSSYVCYFAIEFQLTILNYQFW